MISTPDQRARPWLWLSPVEWAGLMSLLALGVWTRVTGFSAYDLWFDDAWAALPAKVPISTANHMVSTTPAYSLALREWLQLHPDSTVWAQVPSFIAGLAGIVAIFALLRFFRFRQPLPWLGALLVAVGPITSTYSTRVKEYAADLLVACALLYLAEQWRRQPSAKRAISIACVSSLGLLLSAQTLLVTAGVGVLLVVAALIEPHRRRQVAGILGGIALAGVFGEVVWFRHIVPQLKLNWKAKGYMLDLSSPHSASFSIVHMLSGLGHGLFGFPVPFSFQGGAISAGSAVVAGVTGLLLAFIAFPPLWQTVKHFRQLPGPLFAAAVTVVGALGGAIIGATPLGGGSTDEGLYPAIILLLAGALQPLVARVFTKEIQLRRVLAASTAVVVGVLGTYGLTHQAVYPDVDLKGVVAQLGPSLHSGDAIIVDGYASFTWANNDEAPWAVSFHQGGIVWPMGFHVVSRDPRTTLSNEYLQPDQQVMKVLRTKQRLWYVGVTIGASSPNAPAGLLNFPLSTPTKLAIESHGWKPTIYQLHATHSFAILYTHQ
ncbi:MAG: glycosyltransferase family 39 protein [Actinomycetota bacterium]